MTERKQPSAARETLGHPMTEPRQAAGLRVDEWRNDARPAFEKKLRLRRQRFLRGDRALLGTRRCFGDERCCARHGHIERSLRYRLRSGNCFSANAATPTATPTRIRRLRLSPPSESTCRISLLRVFSIVGLHMGRLLS